MVQEPIIEVRACADHPDLPLADMRALLAAAVVKARAQEPPGGSMSLGLEKTLGGGMRGGGWKLQADFVNDERRYDGPQVIVYAYSGDSLAQGHMRVPIEPEYTPEDKRTLVMRRILRWREQRAQLDAVIAEAEAELAKGRAPSAGRCMICSQTVCCCP